MLKPLALCCALASAVAAAQPYTVLPSSASYQPIVGGTPITFTARGGTANDEGFAEVQLGFSFPYWGQSYTSVFVDSNGFLKFGSACTSSCISGHAFPQVPPNPTVPHNVIAGWWDDLDNGVNGQVRYLTSPGQIDIEYSNWSQWLDRYRLTFKITLNSAGVITFHYGTFTPITVSGSDQGYVGIDDLTGANGVSHLPCGASASGCPTSAWPTFPGNNLFSVGSPLQAELSVASLTLSNVVDSAGTLSMTVVPTFRNSGRTAAPPSVWRAWLSTDPLRSADDVPLIASAPAPAVPIQSTATASGNGSAPSPAPGAYYVLVEADFTNVVTEASELNNVGATDVPLIQGLDLQAVSISGPANAGPDTAVQVPVVWRNQGIQSAGVVSFRVVLSADTTYQPTDFVVFSGTRTVTGGQTVSETLSFNMPPNSPGGDFSWVLAVDPANQISEVSETNNSVASGATVNIRPADLINAGFDLLDPATNTSTRVGYFGEPSRMRFTLQNPGGADARNFKVGLVISTDANLSLLSDTLAGETDVALLASGASTTLVTDFTLPLVDRAGQPFKSGTYFLYGVVDSRSNVFELTKGNNNVLLAGTVTLNAPAPDVVVTRVQAPASAGVGELLPVLRELRNLGNRAVSDCKYRYYASANAIITDQDFPLSLQAADGSLVAEGTVALATRDAQVVSEVVRLPASMPAGTFFIGVVVDPANAVAEFDETNNSAVSAPVLVAPASLRIDTVALLDGVLGRPYQLRLAASGNGGAAVSWALVATQGALPEGLMLTPDGTLAGTPTKAGAFGFTVSATQGARVAISRLAMRVVPAASELEITSVPLLPMQNSTTIRYETRLGASGGSQPYTWRLVQGTLPQGLTLSAAGVLAGNPRSTQMDGAVPLTFEVQDAWGTRAQRAFTLRVVAPGALVFGSAVLPDGLVGSPYDRDLAVANADGSALATPLSFSVSRGSLPDGVRLQQAAQVALLTGSPRLAGLFSFSLTVVDARGRTDTADYLVRVGAAGLVLTATGKDFARGGEALELTLSASSGAGAQFTFEGGRLPEGLTLSEAGLISGTVAPAVVPGTYDFVVSARDGTGSEGLGAFSVRIDPPAVVAKGCSASGGTAMGWLLLGVLPLLRRRARPA